MKGLNHLAEWCSSHTRTFFSSGAQDRCSHALHLNHRPYLFWERYVHAISTHLVLYFREALRYTRWP
jgi:hypothetical protein